MTQETYYREINAVWNSEADLLAISCIEYRVVRRTPKGCWIVPLWACQRNDTRLFEKFVLDGKGKRFAYPTREAARASFIIRKQREIQHAAKKHERAVRYLALANSGAFGTKTEALHELHTPDIFTIEPPRP